MTRTSVLFGGAVAALGLGATVVMQASTIGSAGRVAAAPTAGASLARVESRPFATAVDTSACGDFVAHSLDHVTRASDTPARLFDSNGSGVAADDLDGDGRPDIVLGNLEGSNTILWNEGDWRFTSESMTDRATRAVQLVDVDADGRLDIVTTHRGGGVAAFRNLGDRRFERLPLPGVGAAAYSMAWGDLDGDGGLDLVTGSYDAELDQRLRSTFLFSDGAGVFAYRGVPDAPYEAIRLADDSQALATALLDLDLDGRLDVMIGNDFALADMTWSNESTPGVLALEPSTPFDRISAHTMSIDAGDIDNDGVAEVFASDMRPASTDVDVLAEWLPLMAQMSALDRPGDLQQIQNVLQVNAGDGRYREMAERAGLDAAGWAWSSRFGDLDADGDLDLHVVNGMIAAETFPYLDDAALVEPNLAFENRGDGSFALADWGLDAVESGRGSVLVDLDDDGRLDVVVNNLSAPAVAYENRVCGGTTLSVRLHQPGTANTAALGATVTVVTGDERITRTVTSGGGYLSGTPTTLHFGLGERTAVDRIEIRWPDGTTTDIDRPATGHHHEVTRS